MNKNTSKTYSIYIYNSIEDEWDFISSHKKSEQEKLIHDSNRFADCYLFANALLPSFTLISPLRISPAFKGYFETLSGIHCTVLTPSSHTPSMCKNIVYDKKIFAFLISEAKKAGSLTIYAYVITKQIYDLKRSFEAAGILVFLPEAPDETDVWTVSHFGSKSGFRASFSTLMPPGMIELDYKKVPKDAASFFEVSQSGVVLKTNKGNAGQGIHILKKDKIQTKEIFLKTLGTIYKREPFLKKHPLIIETYIDTKNEVRCPFPSVECIIHQNGKIEIPYYCNMIVTPEGEFYGMEMHESVFTQKTKRKILGITMQIARTFKKAGYRGRFDIDMLNDGKKIYANESNTRINGGTDTYLIVKKLVGNNLFSNRYVLSSYIDLPRKMSRSFVGIKKLFAPYLFDKNTKTGLIINSESVIRNGGFSYILVGKNKKDTLSLHSNIKLLLTNKKNK
jgi:hypothetical protein